LSPADAALVAGDWKKDVYSELGEMLLALECFAEWHGFAGARGDPIQCGTPGLRQARLTEAAVLK
jgi:hypothetical protein